MNIMSENQSRNLDKLVNEINTKNVDIVADKKIEENESIIKNLNINASNILLFATVALSFTGLVISGSVNEELGKNLVLSSVIPLIGSAGINLTKKL